MDVRGYTMGCASVEDGVCAGKGRFCQPNDGYAAWSKIVPTCMKDADCPGQTWVR